MATQTDTAWLTKHLRLQTERYELIQAEPWSIDDVPPDHIEIMLKNIAGLEISITCIEAKEKLSQNRPVADQQRVIESRCGADGSALQIALNGEIARRMSLDQSNRLVIYIK